MDKNNIKKITKIMKKIISLWKTYKILRDNAGIFELVEDVFKFIETTHKEQKPMVSRISLLKMGTGENVSDFVSLWAGIGESNPIERAKQLKAQNTELKKLLQLSKKGNLTGSERSYMEFALKNFD